MAVSGPSFHVLSSSLNDRFREKQTFPFSFVAALQTRSLPLFNRKFLLPGMPFDGTHFSKNRPFSDHASNPQSGHACRMSCIHCDLSELLEDTRPPDPELVDLIEQAFIQG